MNRIQNPILPGFHPDPSIVRAGEDFFIATSTFEWFPGVAIYHSRDLKHWKPAAYPLSRISQLDMYGTMDNYGVWAPCLTYYEGIFYLVYSNVHTMNNQNKDCYTYMVTARDIYGKWSDPILLKGNFADCSLYHEGERKWLVFPADYVEEGIEDAVIAIQEYSVEKKKRVGPIIGIFKGTSLGTTEGPHLYRREGYYYLITAEGGTGLGHAVTVARSRSLYGPYETDPNGPALTSRYNAEALLQKAGHADLVQTQQGEWYMVHLCSRPRYLEGKCILGRETAIQKVFWTGDGWLRLAQGGILPAETVEAPKGLEHPWGALTARDDFDSGRLDIRYQSLRIPLGEDTLSLTERPGFLRLKGKESLCSIYRQALIARRQESFRYTSTTCLEYAPSSPAQSAGLVCYYNTNAYHYLSVTYDRKYGTCIKITTCMRQKLSYPMQPVSINGWERCWLRARMCRRELQFWYSRDGEKWKKAGPDLDAGILTDEFEHEGMMNFTGAFVGLCCQDLDGTNQYADFDFWEYEAGEEDEDDDRA